MLDNELFPVEREMPDLHLAVSRDEGTGLLWKSEDTLRLVEQNCYKLFSLYVWLEDRISINKIGHRMSCKHTMPVL